MDLKKLHSILTESTMQLRKGEVVTSSGIVTEINMMPHANDAPANVVKVDMELLVVGVDKTVAEQHKAELVELLGTYPEPDRLQAGPSYIEVGAVIGDQGAAFQLFALGEVLGLWKVITPGAFGFSGEEARNIAGKGFIMISGYQQAA